MSYEGYIIYLCEDGHKSSFDAYSDYTEGNKVCAQNSCGKKFVWCQSIDQTNGYFADDPSTYERELEVSGFDDIWKEDHYGNKYAVKLLKFTIPTNKPGYRIGGKK